MNLKASFQHDVFPAQTDIEMLRKLVAGRKGTYIVFTYNGTRVEVRKTVHGYHGPRMSRVQCYDVVA